MITKKIDLYGYFKFPRNGASGGYLTVYARKKIGEVRERIRPAMLVLPGGGYKFLSEREGEPVAVKYLEKGYATFVLSYSLYTKYPIPLYEAEMAIAYIRENAAEYGVDEKHVVTIGFSAGGHLAGLLATAKQEEAFTNKDIHSLKPNAAILSYAVCTMGKFAELGTCETISGNNSDLYDILSLENRIDKNAVPAFIWHTVSDTVVPVENAFLLANSYRKNGVSFALHIFEHGYHGLSIADEEVCEFTEEEKNLYFMGRWFDLSIDWLTTKGFKLRIS